MTGPIIEVERLSKRYGPVLAVDDLSFTVRPGVVTGFLGPNGAGKTTTLRSLLGLVRPSEGSATISGRRYRDLARPLAEVGASLEATSFHPGRSARSHLGIQAVAAGLPLSRVDQVLELVGLGHAAGRAVGGYSLGMRQRLGLAGALLGDPGALVLDEPINGLDPEGIRWVRGFLAAFAAEGRTVLVSSHVLSEVEQVVDEVVIIARGRSVYQGPLDSLTAGTETVVVDGAERDVLLLSLAPHVVSAEPDGALRLAGIAAADVGRIARDAGVALSRLGTETRSLEQTFLDLVDGSAVPTPGLDGASPEPAQPVEAAPLLPPPAEPPLLLPPPAPGSRL